MSLDALLSVGAASPGVAAPTPVSDRFVIDDFSAPQATTFDSLVSGFEALNDHLAAGTEAAHNLAVGQAGNLHRAMMVGEQARLEFDLMLQVRGKILDAYQELLRMQV